MKNLFKKSKGFLLLNLGCLLFALAYLLFFDRLTIAPGGIGGLAVILAHLSGLSFGLFNVACNLPGLIFGILLLGPKRIAWTIYVIVVSSLYVDLGATFLHGLTGNLFLGALFGGILHGIGIGTVLLAGGSIGGTTLIAQLLKVKVPKLSLGVVLSVMDGIVVLLSLLVFGNPLLAMASLMAVFVTNFVLDQVVSGSPLAKGLLTRLKSWHPSKEETQGPCESAKTLP